MINNLITKLRPTVLSQVGNELLNRKSIAHKIFPRNPNSGRSVSDLFVGRSDGFETIFAAENVLTLLSDVEVEITHKFLYLSNDGQIVKHETVTTHEPIYLHQLSPPVEGIYLFIHLTEYDDNRTSVNLSRLYRQHRNLTGFAATGQSLVNYVHGNIGAVYVAKSGRLKSIVGQSAIKTYSIQEKFIVGYQYDFVLCNPTSRNLDVKVSGFDGELNEQMQSFFSISPFGMAVFKNYGEQTVLSFTSKLPVTRPIVFERSENGTHLNVFHS